MSEHTESLKVWRCSVCGRQVFTGREYGETGRLGHFHDIGHLAGFVPADRIEVIPAEQLVKVEGERDARVESALATAERYRLKFAKGQEDAVADVEADFEAFKERLTAPKAVDAAATRLESDDWFKGEFPESAMEDAIRLAIAAAEQESTDAS